ncbi:MAG: peptidyl-prolyl cis-trans isomerase [Rhizorhabdus sp.]|nr:peptidyl-prolyl cis-trans isomerase [Rhizorhabdus sp.]
MTTSKDDMWSLSSPSARRSLILCGTGAIVGLAIAGLGLFTAKGTRTSVVPAEDVAVVNQVPILMSDYVTQIRALYEVPLSGASAAQKKQVLDDMIREELYVQRGVELGMQADTIEVRTALVGAVEAQAAADATMAQPDEGQLRAWYQAHLATYADEGTMTLDEYVRPGADQAKAAAAVVAELRKAGASPAAAAGLGLRRTARMTDGEEFYFAARIHLGDRLFALAKGLKAGAVSEPVPQPDGLHILVMRHNDSPLPRPFAEVRDRVLADYIGAQAKLLTAGNERFLRKRADIVVQKGFE